MRTAEGSWAHLQQQLAAAAAEKAAAPAAEELAGAGAALPQLAA
jgi:hypothetical protein